MAIRLLVVDDSAFMRKVVADAALEIPGVELAGIARNGEDALEAIERLKPDLVTLDIEMPKMNGLEALKIIKERYPELPVVMLSAYSKSGSAVTMEALDLGALDFIEKSPDKMNDLRASLEGKVLVAQALKERKEDKVFQPLAKRPEVKKQDDVQALVIGASTGGPKVLFEIVQALPENLFIPVFIVQHMPKGFTASFAERLNSGCKLKVVEAQDQMPVNPGVVYVAPGDFHMTVDGHRIRLDEKPKIHGVRPAADPLFFSAAKVYGPGLMGIILTGMGKDGGQGLLAVKEAGGTTYVQARESCVVYGMPGHALALGAVEEVLTLPEIKEKMKRIVKGKTWN